METDQKATETGEGGLSIGSAARVYGISPETIHRHHEAGKFPNAFTDEKGLLRIPSADLESAGFRRVRGAALKMGAGGPPAESEVQQLRLEVVVLKERLTSAQALAQERLDRIEDMRLVLSVLKPLTAATFGSRGAEELAAGSATGLPEAPFEASAGAALTGHGEQPGPDAVTGSMRSGDGGARPIEFPPPPPREGDVPTPPRAAGDWEDDPESLPLIWLRNEPETYEEHLLVEASTRRAAARAVPGQPHQRGAPDWIDETGQEPERWRRSFPVPWAMRPRGLSRHRRRFRWLRLRRKSH